MITLSEINQAYRNASETEQIEFVELILPKIIESTVFEAKVTVVVEKVLKNSFDARLATSELHPIKRIAKLEQVTGLDDFGLEDEHEPTIPEKMKNLEEKIENYEFRPSISPLVERMSNEPTTKTEMRASLLVEALEKSEKDYFSANDIIDFLKCKLPESCKIDSTVKNIRKVKQDVLKTATEMFSNVLMNKKTTGHRDVRLILVS